MKRAWIVLAACTVLAGGVCADELHLKDGSVINGTIVGFDENSFKVKTNYGYAMVRRDQVVSIVVTDTDANAANKPATNPNVSPKPNGAAAPQPATSNFPPAYSATNSSHPNNNSKPAPAPAPTPPAVKPVSASTGNPPSAEITSTPSAPAPATIAPTKKEMAPPTKRNSSSGATTGAAAKPPTITPASPVMIPVSAPPAIPAPKPPEPIRESIDGNIYTNDTYGFRMFRPPGWDMIEEARTVLPGAIAALGTSDQTTYLLVGAGPSAGSLDADLKASDRKLREMVENYRPLGDKATTIAGMPALERRFRGAVDGKDWSGTVVLIERGKEVYTVFGMTYAGTDLVQIQENVIHRAITSLKFTR